MACMGEIEQHDGINMPAPPPDIQVILATSLRFRQHDLETAYKTDIEQRTLVSDKTALLIYVAFAGFWKYEPFRPCVVVICLLQCGKAWLLWKHPSWWLRKRTVLLLAWKCLQCLQLPVFASLLRMEAVSWATFVRLMLARAGVGGGTIALCGHMTSFGPDAIMQLLYLRSAMLAATRVQRLDGGFCGRDSEHFLGQVYSSMQHLSGSLLAPFLGNAARIVGEGSSHTDPCIVVTLFIQVFVMGVVALPVYYVMERRSRLSWWQRHTGCRLPPGEVSWRIMALRTFVLLGLTAALLFSAIDALAPAMQPPAPRYDSQRLSAIDALARIF